MVTYLAYARAFSRLERLATACGIPAARKLTAALQCRETEASSNLSLTLTGTCLALLLIIRTLGLSLAELDDLRTKYEPSGATETKAPTKKVA